MDKSRNTLRKKKLIKDFKEQYGRKVSKYNQRSTNRLFTEYSISIDDLQDIAPMLHRLQTLYSGKFKQEVGRDSLVFDDIYKSRRSLKDTIKFAILEAYDRQVELGVFNTITTDEMHTHNAAVHHSPIYEEYNNMFDALERDYEERNKAMLESKDIRNNRKTYIENDEVLRSVFYGLYNKEK